MKTLSLILVALPALLIATSAQAEAGDAARGKDLSKRCAACHDLSADAKNKVGPALWGVTTRGVAAAEGYKYSDAMAKAGAVVPEWTEEHLLAYLSDPTAWVRKQTGDDSARSRMTFKLADEQQRRDLAAFLAALK